MKTMLRVLKRLDRDERGMETMQAVIVFGVAAVVLAILYKMREPITNWVKQALLDIGITA